MTAFAETVKLSRPAAYARLARLRQILGRDLDQSRTRLSLHLAMLALQVNGVDLTPDHGFPARVIVPALPGVHCTKWVRSINFRAA